MLQMGYNEFYIQLACTNQLQKSQEQGHRIRPAGYAHQNPLRGLQQVVVLDISTDVFNQGMHGDISLDGLIRQLSNARFCRGFIWLANPAAGSYNIPVQPKTPA